MKPKNIAKKRKLNAVDLLSTTKEQGVSESKEYVESSGLLPFIYFEKLPKELQLLIFSFLTPKEQAKLSRVSKTWNKLLNEDKLWEKNLYHFFLYKKQSDETTPAKELYITINATVNATAEKFYNILTAPFRPSTRNNMAVYSENRNHFLDLIRSLGVGFYGLIKNFLIKHPDVNRQYIYDLTLLHIVTELGDAAAVRYLVEDKHADTSIKNSDGDTAFDLLFGVFEYGYNEKTTKTAPLLEIASLIGASYPEKLCKITKIVTEAKLSQTSKLRQ